MAVLCWASTGLTAPVARASRLLSDARALREWIVEHQPAFAGLAARKREAVAATRDARLWQNPTLTLGVGGITLGERNPRTLSFSETQNYQVSLAQTIEIGKRSHRVRSAELHAHAVAADGRFVEATLIAEARENLAKVVYLEARQHVLEDRLQSARGIVELDRTRLDQGDVSGIDHRRLMLDVVNVERELAENANDLAEARSACATAVGAQCDADISVEQLDSMLVPADLPAPVRAVATRPDIAARKDEAASRRELATLAANRVIPDPQIGVAYVHDNLVMAGNQANTLGVYVALPLPIFDHGQHQRVQELERAEQLAAESQQLELAASNDAQYLAAAERVIAEKLAMLKQRALPLGVDVLDSTEKAYRLGQVSMTDLLLARRQRGELALDLVDTSYALYETRSQLRRVLGLDVVKE